MARVLIVDDDPLFCDLLSEIVKIQGHEFACAGLVNEALAMGETGAFDVVFLDVRLPDGNGLDILPKLMNTDMAPEVIIITGLGDADGAELAMKSGVWDYIVKNSPTKDISLSLKRALQYRVEKKANPLAVALQREEIIGSSEPIKACLDMVARAASCEVNVLICGATGTGKELFSRAIHNNSSRASNNFVSVDCATLPDTLVESLLLGYERGAFTGAYERHEGFFKQADNGTIFLDEIAELSVHTQKAFLRALQEQRFRPVGGKKEIASDFRVVTATNRDLNKMVKNKKFREDLLFRLSSLVINLPLLKERKNDIRDLTIYRLAKQCERYKIASKGISPDFFEALHSYDWPGNVRELFNTVDVALSAAMHEATLFPKHLPINIRVSVARSSVENGNGAQRSNSKHQKDSPVVLPSFRDYRNDMEKQYVANLISLSGGDIKQACTVSGLSRSRLYALLQKHDISSKPL